MILFNKCWKSFCWSIWLEVILRSVQAWWANSFLRLALRGGGGGAEGRLDVMPWETEEKRQRCWKWQRGKAISGVGRRRWGVSGYCKPPYPSLLTPLSLSAVSEADYSISRLRVDNLHHNFHQYIFWGVLWEIHIQCRLRNGDSADEDNGNDDKAGD